MTDSTSRLKNISIKALKLIAWTVGILIVLFISLVLIIRSEGGQNFIVGKATQFVSKKIDTPFSIDRIFLTFTGNLQLEGLYLEDQQSDTLVYSETLEASVALLPLIKGETIHIDLVDWNGLTANVKRSEETNAFNFDYIIEAFASDSSNTSQKEPTDASTPTIDIGTITFAGFDLRYIDEVLGIDSRLKLGELVIEMNEFSLEPMIFDIDELTLKNTQGSYIQTNEMTSSESPDNESSDSDLPLIRVNELLIESVNLSYHSPPSDMYYDAEIGTLELEVPEVDLNKNKIRLDHFLLANTQAIAKIYSSTTSEDSTSSEAASFVWPEWDILASDLQMNNNQFSLILDSTDVTPGVFNPSNIEIDDLRFDFNEVSLQNQKAEVILNQLSFKERSGFSLNNLSFDGLISDQELAFNDLNVKTNNNALTASISTSYGSINQLINNPTGLTAKLEISGPRLSAKDAYFFAPELKSNHYLHTLSNKPLSINTKMNGGLDDLVIEQFQLDWGNHTKLEVTGSVFQPTDPNQIRLQDLKYTAKSTKADVSKWMSLDSSGVKLPEQFTFAGRSSGSMNQLTTRNELKTTSGNIKIEGALTRKKELFEYELTTQIDQLKVGEIINNSKVGSITASIKTKGKGESLATLDASLTSEFDSLSYSGYDFTALELNGNIENGKGGLQMHYKDDNLNMDLTSEVELDSVNTVAKLMLDLKGIDFLGLGITNEDVRAQLNLDARFEGNANRFDASLNIEDITVVKNQESYAPGRINLTGRVTPDSTSLQLKSEVLRGQLLSNTNPQGFLQAVNMQFQEYLSVDPSNNTTPLDSNIVVTSSFSIRESTLISDILLPDLEAYDSITFAIDYHQNQDSLVASFNAPYIKYGSSVIDSLRFELLGAPDNLQFSGGWASIDADPVLLKSLELTGRLQNRTLITRLVAPEDKGSLFDIRTELKLTGDTLDFFIQPDTFIINRRTWTLPETNRLLIASEYLNFQSFNMRSKDQYLSVDNFGDQPNQNIAISFDQFKLSNFGSFLNPEDTLVSGLMNGKVSFEQFFTNNALLADFNINNLMVMGADWGNMKLDAEKSSSNDYEFELSLKQGLADIDLTGNYRPDPTVTRLNMDLDLIRLETKLLEGFLEDEISNAEGYLSGHLDISGTTDAPEYSGSINFNDTGLKINTLNTSFKVVNEQLKLDNKGIYFNQFTIQDESGNTFRIGGDILTEDFIDPDLNLTLKANNFMALDSKKSDNELFYGKVGINADLTIDGTVAAPVIRGRAGIRENSDFTVVVPETQADLVEREGIVLFVNRENPDAILTRTEAYAGESVSAFQDIDMNVDLDIGKKAIFKIVINERTGDNFQVSGEGNFNFGLEPNGRTTLAGVYNVSDGHFEASLYNLVKRRFDLAPGGTIKWSGDPLQATLDVSAIYKLKTSPAPIMASQQSDNPDGSSNKYQQKMPFEVYLNVDGTILEPEISFGLDIPEEERGSLGGQVYTKVQELNNSEEQLNKQVFALLVLNRFYPASGSDGASGGAASIARNNVNSVLSGQLNKWSDKLTGDSGFQVDFGLNSYTNETAQENTDLNINASQRLFDDRVIVQVGSEVNIQGSGNTTDQGTANTPLVGNVSLEYLITENGRYRFKGFRKNQYENIIDGQLIVTGFAFIFNREFNRFKDIFANSKEGEFINESDTSE